MSRGLTIADFVQQVLYAQYRVLLDVDESKEDAFHCKSDKFREIVMEGNFTLQSLQKDQDWQWLRDRWELGFTHNIPHGIQEFVLPDDVYKVCTGYNDAVRLHVPGNPQAALQIPFEEARSGNRSTIDMYDEYGQLNVDKETQKAFTVGNTLTFTRPWHQSELGLLIETDVIRYMDPMHICDDSCPDHCPKAYDEILFTEIPDPYYLIVKTAAGRAAFDPSTVDMVQTLNDEATKMLSAMRENDSAHTTTDTYESAPLGYIEVL